MSRAQPPLRRQAEYPHQQDASSQQRGLCVSSLPSCLEQPCHQLQLRLDIVLSGHVLESNSGRWGLWSHLKNAVLGGRVLLCLAEPPQSFRRKPKGRAAANGDPETPKPLL